MKWIFEDGMVFPVCPRCGEYPLNFAGRTPNGHYLLRCFSCGKIIGVKTHPRKLAWDAIMRRGRK